MCLLPHLLFVSVFTHWFLSVWIHGCVFYISTLSFLHILPFVLRRTELWYVPICVWSLLGVSCLIFNHGRPLLGIGLWAQDTLQSSPMGGNCTYPSPFCSDSCPMPGSDKVCCLSPRSLRLLLCRKRGLGKWKGLCCILSAIPDHPLHWDSVPRGLPLASSSIHNISSEPPVEGCGK